MRAITDGARGAWLLVDLHRDGVLSHLAVTLALGAAVWLGSVGLPAIVPPPPPGF